MSDVPNVNFFLEYVNNLRGLPEDDKYRDMFGEKRKFYSSTKENDYLKYVQTGSKEITDYVEYSGNSEKSHGVFNQNGLMSPEDMKILRKNLRVTESVIWHGVISFTEKFGNTYCDNYEKAFEMMKQEMPKFFRNCHFNPDNIEWFAGLHENTDNKHIHFSFFEKSPQRYKRDCERLCYSDGFLPEKVIARAKASIELNLMKISFNVNEKRKLLTEELKNIMQTGVYMNKINSLVIILPREGRMQYDSENLKKYRPHIDLIINQIISNNDELSKKFYAFNSILSTRDSEMVKAYSRMKRDCSDLLLRDKCINDLYRRLGNIVLYSVKQIRQDQMKCEFETKKRLQIKRIEKNKRKALINRCMQLNDLVNREIINAFEDYQALLERANNARLREEGYLD
ncbi:MAG: hypothetical protein IKI95_03190 [Clostridia bacterium]|nr:hypothetical protein [Clostridia bacterium]